MGLPLRDADKELTIRELAERADVVLPPLVLADKEESIRRIFAATGQSSRGPLLNVDAALDDLEVAVVAYEAGGDDRPAWVPAGWDIWIDLQRAFNEEDAAWISGTGTVAVDTLLGADANTENGYSATAYDPLELSADGLTPSVLPVAFLGVSRTAILAGTTVRLAFNTVDPPQDLQVILLSADGNDGVGFASNSDGKVQIYSYGGSVQLEGDVGVLNTDAVNAQALTVTATRGEIAVNGGHLLSATFDETDRPPGNPLVAALFDATTGVNASAVQSIGIKTTPLPDTTGLSELSEE